MILIAAAFAVGPAAAMPATVADGQVAAAVDVALAACEQWLLEPRTWADDLAGFPKVSGLAARGLVAEALVPEIALPPVPLRQAMHHWRVPIGEGGIYLTTSDRQPICYLAGGGQLDLQPGTAAAIQSKAFLDRWKPLGRDQRDEMLSGRYASREDDKLVMTISYAAAPGGRRDRVQFVATAQYDSGN